MIDQVVMLTRDSFMLCDGHPPARQMNLYPALRINPEAGMRSHLADQLKDGQQDHQDHNCTVVGHPARPGQ
jgi:hypothetical protein